MQIKSDMIENLAVYGRLPQPSIQDYLNEISLNGSMNPSTEVGAAQIEANKLRKDLVGTQSENERLQKERAQLLQFIKQQGLHEKLNEASEIIF